MVVYRIRLELDEFQWIRGSFFFLEKNDVVNNLKLFMYLAMSTVVTRLTEAEEKHYKTTTYFRLCEMIR